jgi:hypothetical protein
MPSTYSPDLRIELIANGEQSGTWGTTTNTNLGTLIEDAIAGRALVAVTSANQALTASNGAADQARCAAVDLSIGAWGSPANFAVYVPPVTKLYVVRNTDSTYTATVYCSTVLGNTTAAGTGVAIPAGKTVLLRSDGTNVVEQLDYIAGGFTVNGALSVGGALTLGTDLSVANGGTGASSFTANNVLLGNGTSSFQTVAPGASGNVLTSDGTTWASSAVPPVNALGDPGANGVVVRTALNTTTARTITAGTGISITNGDGVAGNPTITNSSPSIGVSQTWQDVKSSRAIGSTYTNSTGRPIMVIVTGQNSGTSSSSRLSFTVAGVTVGATTLAESNGTAWNSVLNPITFIVPDGETYSATQSIGTSTIFTWVELR